MKEGCNDLVEQERKVVPVGPAALPDTAALPFTAALPVTASLPGPASLPAAAQDSAIVPVVDVHHDEAGFGAQYAQAPLAIGNASHPTGGFDPGDGDWRTRAPALRHLGTVAGTLLLFAISTYAIPGLSDWRPWMPGESLPMAKMLALKTGDSEGDGNRTIPEGPLSPQQARAAAVETLGSDLAKNLSPETLAAGEGADVPDVPETHSGIKIDLDEMEGLVRPIEDPSGRAMDAFYMALARTAGGKPGAVTRIAHWGDSTIAADDVTGTLRRRFQKRFGDAGHGFHLAGKGSLPYRHKDVRWDEPRNWALHSVISDDRKDGRYGYGGFLQRASGGVKTTFGTSDLGPVGRSFTRFELWYQAHPEGGALEVSVDAGAPQVVTSRSDSVEDRWWSLEVDDGPHQVTVKAAGGGDARVYGVTMERPGPGVVYDSMGIVGARASRMLNADSAHFADQVGHRSPDLLVIAFGGNEAGDDHMNFDKYREQLSKVIKMMRAGRPQASCLLMAPLDQGEVGPRGGVRTMPTIPRIVESQRAVAAAEGCAFFDTWTAMGGNGAMGRWYKSRPRLGWGDYRHASPAGYEVIGSLFYKALLKGFSDFLQRPAAAVPPVSSGP